jgi:hypothetical protein
MILTEFNKFKATQQHKLLTDRQMVSMFVDKKYPPSNLEKFVKDVIYDIYRLQVCVEGLIEDADAAPAYGEE